MSRMRRNEWLNRQHDFRLKNSSRHDRRLGFEPLEERRLLAVVTVDNALDLVNGDISSIISLIADDGEDGISLREALEAANATAGTDTIAFGLSGQVITPGSALPLITDSVVIDATTAPGYAGEPLVTLDGFNAGAAAGLYVLASAPNSEIHGLSVIRFTDGIVLESNDNLVSQNYVGINPSGGTGVGNAFDGIILYNVSGNVITENIISGNFRHGLLIDGSGSNVVTNNRIGTDADGLTAVGNAGDGVQIFNSSSNQIGGVVDTDRNIISGNQQGVTIIGSTAPASNNAIQGNYIGTDVTGMQAIRNLGDGIQLWNVTGASNGAVTGNLIGGDDDDDGSLDGIVRARNIISGNTSNGVVLFGSEVVQNHIEGNWIGLTADGQAALPNSIGVNITNPAGELASQAASSNTIGGISVGAGNVISGNTRDGIQFGFGTFSNLVLGNFIGTDISGGADSNASLNLGNSRYGILISDATDNLVGGVTVAERNVIAGNLSHGVAIKPGGFALPTVRNQVLGNYIGVLVDGVTEHGNGSNGVFIEEASDNIIGGTAVGAGNVISGNLQSGVEIAGVGATFNRVEGNWIGTTADGSAALQNQFGVVIQNSASGNTIGGDSTNFRNVISGNAQAGLLITGAGTNDNKVQWNSIGTNEEESGAIPNQDGIRIEDGASNNSIGGIGSGNLIAGNTAAGVLLGGVSTTDNKIKGNHIGTTADGMAPLPNSFGVVISDSASGNTIGGDSTNFRNVISGNAQAGVLITGAGTNDNKVQWNSIGTNEEESGAIPNQDGIRIEDGASNNSIGGIGSGNLIAGNTATGILLSGASTTGNKIKDNYIGVSATEVAIANGNHGILIGGANNSMIGGTDAEDGSTDNTVDAGNKIAFNGTSLGVRGHGVVVESGTGNAIRGNSIYKNEGRGIDLGNDSFTLNDYFGPASSVTDTDTGANNLQNNAFVSTVSFEATQKTVEWTLYSTPNTAFTLDFFSNSDLDASGFGEGKNYLYSATLTTNNTNGFASLTQTISLDFQWLAVTVTDPLGNTSEFSMVDTDGDAIADAWETPGLGIDFDEDGAIDLDLAARGARPDKKDVLVEIDSMVGFTPSATVLKWVKNGRPGFNEGFSQAPANLVQNPDGSPGINLILELDETITGPAWIGDADGDGQRADAGDTDDQDGFPFFDKIKANTSPLVSGGLGTVIERIFPNIIEAKRLVYHYTIFADQFASSVPGGGITTRTSGIAEIFGNDVIVSLGAWNNDGTPEERAGTFMHELGHNLGLDHGGNDAVNHKPNYHSVLNYTWQNPGAGYEPGWRLDYSRAKRATLNESSLNEAVGLGGNPAFMTPIGPIVDSMGNAIPELSVNEGGGIDLNGNGLFVDSMLSRDLNHIYGTAPSPGEMLIGHNDWSALWFNFRVGSGFADGVQSDTHSSEINLDIDLSLDSIGVGPGAVQFTHSQYEVDESGVFAEIQIIRAGGKDGEVSVDYDFVADSAIAGQDFTPLSGTLTFAHAEFSKTIQIPIIGDILPEIDETVSLTLSNPTNGAALGARSTSELVIVDDDGPGQLQFLLPSYIVSETAGMLNVVVERIGGMQGAITVDFELVDGTALSTQDYVDAGGTLAFADGQASQIISVQINDDQLGEGSEYFHVTLSSPTGGALLGNPSTTAITIDDNESQIVVTNSNDSGSGSLRQATQAANLRPGADTITFNVGIFATPQTILLNTGDIEISDAVTIIGPGQELLTIDAGQQSRIFDITATTGDFTLSGLSIAGGRTIVGGSFSDDIGSGGAIRSLTTGSLFIDQSTVSDSSTAGNSARGGGIFAFGDLTLTGSTVSGNSTEGNSGGGGIVSYYGDITLIQSTVSGNSTTADNARGGGVYTIFEGAVTLIRSTVSGNSATNHGGGIYSGGALTLTDSTVSGNISTGSGSHGGGIHSVGALTLTSSTVSGNTTTGFGSDGGGIYVQYGALTLSSSTVSGNSTAGEYADGGGIKSFDPITLIQSTVTDNHAYHATSTGGGIWNHDQLISITGSILAGNTAGGGMDDFDPANRTLNVDFSLIEQTGLLIAGGNNIIGQSANLGPLANNSGPTPTHALLPGSLAIDAGDPSIVPNPVEFDQRGSPFLRVFDDPVATGSSIDMGAFEVQPIVASADFDSDGDVDGSDFLVWQRGIGTSIASKSDGDADNDTDVDGDDLGIWQNQFGQPGPIAAAAVNQSASISSNEPAALAVESVAPMLSANLIDAALTLEWMNASASSDNDSLVFEEYDELLIVPQKSAERDNLLSKTSRSSTDANTGNSTNDDEDVKEAWLSEELLERVFG